MSIQYAIYVINHYRIIYRCYGCKITVLETKGEGHIQLLGIDQVSKNDSSH